VRMPLTLYMDVHVPIVVTESLRRKGLDVLTSQDDGTATLDDETLLARASELGRVLFSQDQDFTLRPWFGRGSDSRTFGERRVPTQREVGWLLDGVEFIYWRGSIGAWSLEP
jgi:hypothetical protein